MRKYKIIEIIVSLALGIFIVSFGFVITAHNRSVYAISVERWKQLNNMTNLEAVLIFDEIADDFCDVSNKEFSGNYIINKENASSLFYMQSIYKRQLVKAVIAFVIIIFGIILLKRRRKFNWLLYGGILAVLFTAIKTILLSVSHNKFSLTIKNMIFEDDYSPFFNPEDQLLVIIPDAFARNIAVFYLIVVGVMVFVAVFIRLFIIYCGRPHKF